MVTIISAALKQRRIELGISQQDLAEKMGYKSRSSIAKIESGEVDLPLSKLLQLADILEISPDKLFAGTTSVTPGQREPTGASQRLDGSRTIAIVLAGGKSTRNRQNTPNQFVNVLGKPVIVYCLETLQQHPLIDEICVACLKGWEDVLSAYAKQYGITKLTTITTGSKSGIQSLKKCLDRINARCMPTDTIFIHEATRPLLAAETISKVIQTCKAKGSASSYHPMKEYVQFLKEDDTLTRLDRNAVITLQSPEAYTYQFIEEAFSLANNRGLALGDSWFGIMAFELGLDIGLVEDASNSLKIVRKEDIATFAAIASSHSA